VETIVPIKGNVQHIITMDPGVWIFDDRRIDLETFFTVDHIEKDEMEEYKKNMGKHWSREIMEGAVFPPTLKTEKKFERTKVLTGTFGIYLHHFLKNAEPKEDAQTLIFESSTGEQHTYPLTKAEDLILKFSHKGKPLQDGPVHLLEKDGSNQDNPLRDIVAVIVE
jgi:hypothetical protein